VNAPDTTFSVVICLDSEINKTILNTDPITSTSCGFGLNQQQAVLPPVVG
jgi:hypothetical protein